MLVKKLGLSLILGFTAISTAFAGTEDWNGTYTVRASNNSLQTVTHTSKNVQFMFLSAGKCLKFGKGSKINGIEFKDNIELCTLSDANNFTLEVQKIGPIVDKKIVLGPTYPNA